MWTRMKELNPESFQMKKTTKQLLTVLLVLSSFVYAKDKTLADFPLRLEVMTQDFGGKGTTVRTGAIVSNAACNFAVADEKIAYVVENRNVFSCHTFTPGTILSAREASVWGQPYIEFAWTENGKLKTQKYNLLYKRLLPNRNSGTGSKNIGIEGGANGDFGGETNKESRAH